MSQSNFLLQQTVKALLDAHRPKIRVFQESNNGRSLEVKIKSQVINIPIETNKQYRSTIGSFR
jgi:hypothetical protein